MGPYLFSEGRYHMKRRWLLLTAVTLLALGYSLSAVHTTDAAKLAKASCKSCHVDFASVIPKEHPPVKGTDLQSCIKTATNRIQQVP